MTDQTEKTQEDVRRAGDLVQEAISKVWQQIRDGELNLAGPALVDQIRLSLQELRRYIEDPIREWVNWDRPFVETTFLVDCEIELAPGRVSFLTSEVSAKDLEDGELPEKRLEEMVSEYFWVQTLHQLTRGVIELTSADEPSAYIFPTELAEYLDQTSGTRKREDGFLEGTEEGAKRRAELVDKLTRPYSLGEFGHEDLDALGDTAELLGIQRRRGALSALTFASGMNQEEGRLKGSVVALVYPLSHDPDRNLSWFTIGVGLAFTEGDPRKASPEDLADLWEALDLPPQRVGTLEAQEQGADSGAVVLATGSGFAQETTALRTQPAKPRTLQDAKVRMDGMAARTVGFFGGISLWKKWDSVPVWEDLVQKEVQRIRDDLGDLAFTEDQYRDALLVRKYDRDGNVSVRLTRAAVVELEERVGPKSFRRTEKDPDKARREYLVKRVRAGQGSLTVKFSWYGGAELLSEGVRERLAQKIREDLEADERDLFGGDPEVRAIRENWLERLGTMNDAAVLAPRLLALMYQQRSSRVTLPAWEGYLALGIESDPHRRARLEGALFALRELEFVYQGEGLGRGMDGGVRGSFVLEYGWEKQRGEDSDFTVHLSEWAVGSLGVFEKARGLSKLKNPVLAFDWQAKLTKDQKKDLRFVRRFSALGSYYNRAQGLTSKQKRLMEWIEHEVTLRRDKTAKGRTKLQVRPTAEDAEEPRIYRADFCPLLPPDREYHAALGHFVRNAETGRKLKGRSQEPTKSGGQRHGGLLEVMGYDLLPGRASQAREDMASAALRDLRAVVEEYLGGKVAGKLGDQWIDLQGTEGLSAAELLEGVSWFPFLPADWNEVRRRKFEEHHQRRYEAGERDRPVRVLPPRTLTPDEISKDPVGLDGLPLKMRLRGHRRRLSLSLEEAGKVFGLPKVRMYKWEKELDEGGVPIPEYWEPLLWAWIRDGKEPTEAELEEVKNRPKRGRK